MFTVDFHFYPGVNGYPRCMIQQPKIMQAATKRKGRLPREIDSWIFVAQSSQGVKAVKLVSVPRHETQTVKCVYFLLQMKQVMVFIQCLFRKQIQILSALLCNIARYGVQMRSNIITKAIENLWKYVELYSADVFHLTSIGLMTS